MRCFQEFSRGTIDILYPNIMIVKYNKYFEEKIRAKLSPAAVLTFDFVVDSFLV